MDTLIEVLLVWSIIFNIDRVGTAPKSGFNILTANSVECVVHDPSYLRVSKCELKPVNRNMKLISWNVVLLEEPLSEGTLTISLLKRANGYKPFVYKATVDICKYLDGQRSIAVDWLYKSIKPYWNVNHSCPYEGELQLEKMPSNKIVLPSIFPEGDYKFIVQFIVHHIPRLSLITFLSIQEK